MLSEKREVAAILGIGTALPPHRVGQEEAAERVAAALAGGQALANRLAERAGGTDRAEAGSVGEQGRALAAEPLGKHAEPGERHTAAAKWVRRLFRQCAVDTRYVCDPEPAAALTTAERGRVYREHALPLALEAAGHALADAGVNVRDITHVLAVSCTGLYLPGLDAELVRSLGIARDAVRMPLSFAGCAAGLRAIGIAKELAERGGADVKALVVCVELCTLHVKLSERRSELLAAALFGDGASACVIGAASAAGAAGNSSGGGNRLGVFTLGACRSVLLPEGERDMTWDVGDAGYELHLSPRIPELLGRYLPDELAHLEGGSISGEGGAAERKERLPVELAHGERLWAIHPGGRSILDAVERLYGLSGEQLRPSREVLRRCGNMSSATILFVLEELRAELEAAVQREPEGAGRSEVRPGIALAFGPGLTAELQQFAYVPSPGVRRDDGAQSAAARRPGATERPYGDDSASDAAAEAMPLARKADLKVTAE